jgi:hypothetical protein
VNISILGVFFIAILVPNTRSPNALIFEESALGIEPREEKSTAKMTFFHGKLSVSSAIFMCIREHALCRISLLLHLFTSLKLEKFALVIRSKFGQILKAHRRPLKLDFVREHSLK